MSLKRYRVEVSNPVICQIQVAADSEDEAIEKINQGEGELGHEMPGEPEILSIKEIGDE